MNRSNKKQSSSSFDKFVAHLQRTITSSINAKSSTFVIQQERSTRTSFSTVTSRVQLSDILYKPSRPIESLSEIKEKDDSYSYSSCDSISSTHHADDFNLSQMNISMNYRSDHCAPQKCVKLLDSITVKRLHSTAVHNINH
ncbi:unnamed protein product [Rotaria magnacalcarata]|uniref:Uncharacterized protein n=2 Tax=Rotaria magnacalcarata TaxID=392030 RepID=A0A816RH45_9BILA|nr:unnamed protein product [Rotaria magnacalcarata]CAF4151065.1 unnamed protein product [Rotaria magnacalcarata]